MVNVPRKDGFAADMALIWQGRARTARAKIEQLQSKLGAAEAKLKAIGAFADEMAKPECEANEVDDCDICQGYIKHAKRLKAILKGK